jgi:hypothetical protein
MSHTNRRVQSPFLDLMRETFEYPLLDVPRHCVCLFENDLLVDISWPQIPMSQRRWASDVNREALPSSSRYKTYAHHRPLPGICHVPICVAYSARCLARPIPTLTLQGCRRRKWCGLQPRGGGSLPLLRLSPGTLLFILLAKVCVCLCLCMCVYVSVCASASLSLSLSPPPPPSLPPSLARCFDGTAAERFQPASATAPPTSHRTRRRCRTLGIPCPRRRT